MITHSNRGEVTLVIVLVCAVAAGIGLGGFTLGKQSGKAETTEEHKKLEQKAAAAAAATEEAHKKADAAGKATAHVVVTHDQQDQAVAGFVKGTSLALQDETEPLLSLRVARVINEGAASALPEATSKQVEEFTKIIEELKRDRAIVSASLNAKITEARDLRTKADAAERDAKAASEAALAATLRSAELSKQVDAQAKVVIALTREKESLWDWLKLIAWIAGGLWVLSLILPLLSKAFPALKPLATVFGGAWSPGVQILKSGADQLKADMIALQEFTKTKMALKFSKQEMADFKKDVKNWWDGDLDAQNEIERIKARTLRV